MIRSARRPGVFDARRRAGTCRAPPGCKLRPVALDRFGLRIRAEARGGHRDVLVPFAAPITAPDELPEAIATLLSRRY